MKYLYLLSDKLANIQSFLSIVDLKVLILGQSLVHKFFLIALKQNIQFLKNLQLVFHQLVMDTLPHAQNIVINPVVVLAQLLEHNNMLVAFLLGVADGLQQIYIGRFVVFYEVLLSVLDYAVGAQRHQALHVAAEVGKELGRVVRAEDFPYFGTLRHGGGLCSRHNR